MQACLGFKTNSSEKIFIFFYPNPDTKSKKNDMDYVSLFLAEEFDNITLLYEFMQIKWRQMRGSSHLSDMPLMYLTAVNKLNQN